ncbi:TIGR02996 domain-containing protein [Urbifossiella limnaea]|uniref:DUF1963 domain-containing protein n=1 Tax=Urbifossiella limnaea TaxID=2528023 RepID=A0A517Y3F9_9BACT|nr:TIGR02996 domain-containing protein [Urbifossiella limnaea]QDU24271.1 hypothetical protein ETAA1_62850 [Urbifossiella limnaea]
MATHVALPNPAAFLPGEGDFLAGVLGALSDDTPRLVYADWLDDQDDPRGPFLRDFVAALRSGDPLPPSAAFHRPWRDLVGVTLVELARGSALAARASDLLGVALPALSVHPSPEAVTGLPVGVSRYGGEPDLPAEVPWPTRASGAPLPFVGQYNLADLVASPAARGYALSGMLSVFYALGDPERDDGGEPYDGTEPEGWRPIVVPPGGPLSPRAFPAGLSPANRWPAHPITFEEALSLPDPESSAGTAAGITHDFWWHYHGMVFNGGEDQLLGHPTMPDNWYKAQQDGTHHLLAFASGSPPFAMTGDGWFRVIRLFVPADDLRIGRLDRVVQDTEPR